MGQISSGATFNLIQCLSTNCNIRNLQHEMSVSADTESEQEYLNQPNIKFQPHGHLTLAAEQDMEQLVKDHEMQKVRTTLGDEAIAENMHSGVWGSVGDAHCEAAEPPFSFHQHNRGGRGYPRT